MPAITGQISPQHGATVFVKVMQSPEYVMALKSAGLAFRSPELVLGILDTGASGTALDSSVIAQMGLQYRGNAQIHTPTTGPSLIHRNLYDATLVIGEFDDFTRTATVPVIESDFASRDFHALVGRDVLKKCVLTYDGPSTNFTLSR